MYSIECRPIVRTIGTREPLVRLKISHVPTMWLRFVSRGVIVLGAVVAWRCFLPTAAPLVTAPSN